LAAHITMVHHAMCQGELAAQLLIAGKGSLDAVGLIE
jgi:hypothetical protein